LVMVNNVLAWDWFEWITDDFELVLPYMNVSLSAAILMNAVFMVYDATWFKSLDDALLAALSLIVIVRTYQVFPFDFSSYALDLTAIVRVVLIFTMACVTIGLFANVIKLIGGVVPNLPSTQRRDKEMPSGQRE
ncbi:MAG: hypothetical protein ABFR53_07305, partial [Actinomycetota bacterium]